MNVCEKYNRIERKPDVNMLSTIVIVKLQHGYTHDAWQILQDTRRVKDFNILYITFVKS